MKKYRVNVNGKAYEIEIELISEAEATVPVSAPVAAPAAAPAPVAAPAAAPAPAPEAASASVASGEGEVVTSPMPGTIVSVNVKSGESVKKGQVLMILEAMKMENEIMAGADGTVTSVNVSVGQTVETGTPLCTIK